MKMRLLSSIFLSILCTWGNQAVCQISRAEFRAEVQEHRSRVQANALLLLEKFPQHFPELTAMPKAERMQFVEIYLATHDMPKLMNIEQLKSLGYKGEDTFFEKLFANWGKALKRRPPFIQDLNYIEDRYKELILSKHFSHMNQEHFQKILRDVVYLEFVVDETDTKIHRGRELGVEMKPLDAQYLFINIYKDKLGAKLAEWLELQVYNRHSLIRSCEAMFQGVK